MQPVRVLANFTLPPEKARILWTAEAARTFLERVVETTGLNKITESQVIEHDGHIDGHVVIAESHIHVWLFPEGGLGAADVFSCQPVSDIKIEAVVYECFFGNPQDGRIDIVTLPSRP
jgi:S-adenosylmethionine/arginine decarboxylase-like enzyme